jgi:hypothetical protein
MVETWFKEKLHTFEEHEMNVHENFADFLEMVGLKFWMKRQINRTWAISVYENREHLASLCLIFKEGELVGAHVQTELPSSTEIPLSKIEIPLADLITWFTVGNSFGKMRSFFSMVTHNLLRRPIQVFLQRS